MDKVEIEVTWGLVWALLWRGWLIGLGISAVIWLILFLVGVAALIPFLGSL